MARLIGWILAVVLLVLGLTFAVLNAEPVEVKYYFGGVRLPLAVLLVSTLIAGALLGVAASLVVIVRQRRRIAHLKRQVRVTEKELMNLRNMPIKDAH
ncbi:MAG: LapA family protein [Gammaproteobacteria bacterium]|nr:LapA family protein [Gammaproteobacteria bacterium]